MSVSALPPAFGFHGITKRFAHVVANDDVSFAVEKGSLHGIVGENGAGKSTIMKILYGMYPPDAGRIDVNGIERRPKTPQEAIALGIGMVHQHFMLIPTLRVWENVVLGHEPSFALDAEEIRKGLSAIVRDYGFTVDLNAVTEDLSVGQQQQVEILKLLYRNAEILILDEPTAVLTPQEVDVFFDRLKGLWKAGKTIVIITHKLKEVLRFTQRVTVMRRGRVVETIDTAQLTEKSLAEKIIGRQLAELPKDRPAPGDGIAIHVKGLAATDLERGSLKGLSFQVNAGEILGVAGVEGNGQALLVECLAGVRTKYEGSITYGGKDLKTTTPYRMKQEGLALIPPDRHREAVVLDFSVSENYVLGHHREARFSRHGWLSPRRITAEVAPALEAFDVRPREPEACFAGLSGGNQQKLVVAREMGQKTGAKYLIAAHPTRGVDIGAIEQIHRTLLEHRKAGAAILLISSELEEILALSDRIIVLFDGKISGHALRAQATEQQLGLWMTGGQA